MRKYGLCAILLFTLIISACRFAKTDLYDRIVIAVESDPVKDHVIYDRASSETSVELRDLEELRSFEFVFDVGDFASKSYVNCGGNRLPINDPWIMARHSAGIHGYGYRLFVTSDENCNIQLMTAVSLPVARL